MNQVQRQNVGCRVPGAGAGKGVSIQRGQSLLRVVVMVVQ